MSDGPRVLALVGPTGTGKSSVALDLAERLGGEIVSCDSVQVYRGFDCGSAKPTAAEQARVRHHLIDVVDWHQPFDAQRYRTLAETAVAEIRARGRTPIICGGTGLYLRLLRWGLADAPAADSALRARLEREEQAEPGVLFRRLAELDPTTAAEIDRHNPVRILRALEICLLAGEPASRVRARHAFATEVVPMKVILLEWEAARLKQRIFARAEQMVAADLVGEVERLLAAGVAPDCRPMQAVGYVEASAVATGRAPLAGLGERIGRSTWAYAKRQRTWFRREREVEVLPLRDLTDAWRVVLEVYDRSTGSPPIEEGSMTRKGITIAIDGPAGAGKSTVSMRVAEALAYTLVDTGAIYRTVALIAERRGIDWNDDRGLATVVGDLSLRFALEQGVNRVFLDDEEITAAIRTPHISDGASKVSAQPSVRAGLLELQRRLAGQGGAVLEGRDIGTVVFPDAPVKIFLEASAEERARRRLHELAARGVPASLPQVLAEIRERDERDQRRTHAPLVRAPDAQVLDSTAMSVEEVVAEIVALARQAGG